MSDCVKRKKGLSQTKLEPNIYIFPPPTIDVHIGILYFSLIQPTFHDSSIPMGPYFQDLPYTEWISQRWTYHETPFANWPTLPPEILEIQQILAGKIGSSDGLWLLSYSELYFVHGLNGSVPTDVVFLNISEELDLEITPNSYIFSTFSSTLYVITSQNITYLDCSSLE